ncbi:MAG: zinc-dependent alcohol dehydrogenase family protein [Ktedonobacterales bacterium]|nr:zinc-dependent alcohol dehydrogenase family protein [Ktedonobacterales bacterium]
MRAAVFHAPQDIRISTVPDPRLIEPTDAIVRITHACICGSDLWFYRGIQKFQPGWRTGHEWMGIVEDVGAEVRTVKKGDRVIAPFAYSDGTCEYCQAGLQTACVHGGGWGGAGDMGGQAEAIRTPYADGTLVAVPESASNDPKLLAALLPLTDVLSTGHHAAVRARVQPGSTVAVIGDGAVGLCGVLAAKRLGAERIIILGHQPARLAIAKQFGATDIVAERGAEAIAHVNDLTNGGAASVMECVGTEDSLDAATQIVRPGAFIGFVGVPHGVKLGLRNIFSKNAWLSGGPAPVRAYIPELMTDVLAGKLDATPVFDLRTNLDGVPDGYAAMDSRQAIKAMIQF